MPSSASIIISGYTEAGYGAGPGISRFVLAEDGLLGERQVESSAVLNASFLANGGDVLLAVEELTNGTVLALDPQSLDVMGRASSGGADTCHVALVDGNVWAANYSSGTASVTPLSSLLAEMAPEPLELVSHPGSGPVADRQGESHAHQVTATKWGTVLVSDLGSDRVDEYSAASLVLLGSAELPPGTGPRHVALKGDFLLVAGELDGHLHVLRRTAVAHTQGEQAGKSAGGYFWHWLFKTPLAENAEQISSVEEFFPSHIQLSGDGRKLYAAVRGPDTLVVLDVSRLPDSELPDLELGGQAPTPPSFLLQVPSGGNWPRHFALSPEGSGSHKLYVANQLSNNVAVFELDQHGLPGAEPVQIVEFGSPACILLSS
ncbi:MULTISPECIES: lactonase family protein [Arthrobacter]|uniref:lactonase family protein n=1 Tax=Arthrobacter TaxID=1663 RepID=UPI00053629E2|nr:MULTISPECIES: beta-propeller fold lactonase family protein [Arthrobacter]AIY03780.1 hypothetical protein ART_4181 [Arthrobacter sp. PAMC 25486]